MKAKTLIALGVLVLTIILLIFYNRVGDESIDSLSKDTSGFECTGGLCTTCMIEGSVCECGPTTCECGQLTVERSKCY